MKIEEMSRQEIIDKYLDGYILGNPIPVEIKNMIQEFFDNDVASNSTTGTEDFD